MTGSTIPGALNDTTSVAKCLARCVYCEIPWSAHRRHWLGRHLARKSGSVLTLAPRALLCRMRLNFLSVLVTREYMKKFAKNPVQHTVLQLLGTVAVVMLLASLARGEVYQCTGTDGKTAFSDQPCEASQKSSTLHPKAASGASVGTAAAYKTPPTMDYKSRPEYPECLWLKPRLDNYFMGPVVGTTGKQAEQARDDLARYKEICAVVDQAAGRALTEKR